MGSVGKKDKLFFKEPGGGVFATAKISSLKESVEGKTFVTTFYLKKPDFLKTPFPVNKRDRRVWVACLMSLSKGQQELIVPRELTLRELGEKTRKRYQNGLTKKDIAGAITFLTNKKTDDNSAALLLILAFLMSNGSDADLQRDVLKILSGKTGKVNPLTIF